VQPIVDRAREAGATFLGGVALHLRDEVRDVFFAWLEAKRPDLIPRYEQLYAKGRAYLPAKERGQVTKVVRGWGRSGASRRRGRANTPRGGGSAKRQAAHSPGAADVPSQDSLF
jgi:DNA repair photolyase